ncbi:MAG: hypothetical protein R3B91_21915 [Planctomycetaceae bacterium]
MGPIPHHMHQNAEQAALVGQEGKPESYYFPPQMNAISSNFPYTFMGLEPATKQDVVDCLDRWNQGENGILDLSKAYRLKPGAVDSHPPCPCTPPAHSSPYELWAWRVRHVPELSSKVVRSRVPCSGLPEGSMTTTSTSWTPSTGTKTSTPTTRIQITSNRSSAKKGTATATSGSSTAPSTASNSSPPRNSRSAGRQMHDQISGASPSSPPRAAASLKVTLDSPVMILFGAMTEDEVFVTRKRPNPASPTKTPAPNPSSPSATSARMPSRRHRPTVRGEVNPRTSVTGAGPTQGEAALTVSIIFADKKVE